MNDKQTGKPGEQSHRPDDEPDKAVIGAVRIEKLVTTNSIWLPPEKRHPKIETLSVAPMLADIISRIHQGVSISEKLILA